MVAEKWVKAGGVKTRYLEAGQPGGVPLILLHDGTYGSDASVCWGPVLELLAEEFHVLAPDLLGYGGTDKLVYFDRDPLTQRIAHLASFCESLCIDRAYFAGNSFGGAVVLRTAAFGGLPVARGITLCGTGGLFMRPERFSELQNYQPSLEAAARLWSLVAHRADPEQVRRRYENSLIPGHWEALAAAAVRNPARPAGGKDWLPEYSAGLGRIQVPILIVAGADDLLLEPGWERELAAMIPGAVTHRVEQAMHSPQADQPREVARVIRQFLH